ncbi:MAG: TIGR02996 domain-containing protein [Fimbriiglobus sp.]
MDTVNPDLQALLNTCRSAVADDLPRLVLADWLEENNDGDRAEFIRIQCELARPTVDTSRTQMLKRNERELIAANWHRWVGKLLELLSELQADQVHSERLQYFNSIRRREDRPRQTPPVREVVRIDPFAPSMEWGFRRGLVHLNVTEEMFKEERVHNWLASPEAVWLQEATCRHVGIRQLAGWRVPAVFRPYLGISLDCPIAEPRTTEANPLEDGHARNRRIAAALTCKNFALVRDLTVSVSQDVPELLAALMAADLSRVQRLRIDGQSSVLEAVIKRLVAMRFENLSSLDISMVELDQQAVKALVTSPNFPNLVSLSAYRNNFGDAATVALAKGPLGKTLNRVEFMNCGIGDQGLVALVKSGLIERVFGPQLNLSMNPIADRGMKALAQSPGLERFTELIMRECSVSDSGAKAVALSSYVRNLKYLDLWKNNIGDTGALALAQSPHLDGIHDLSLRDNPIGGAGQAALRKRFGQRVKLTI